MKRKFIKYTRDDIDALLIRFDKDKDTKISELEFYQIINLLNIDNLSLKHSSNKSRVPQKKAIKTKKSYPKSDLKYKAYDSLNRSLIEINSEEKERINSLSPIKFATLK